MSVKSFLKDFGKRETDVCVLFELSWISLMEAMLALSLLPMIE